MITAAAGCPSGVVRTLGNYAPSDFPAGSAILCRNNAPLIAHAFAAIRRDIPVRILGREIGAGLTKVIKSFKVAATGEAWCNEAQEKLGTWRGREIKKVKRLQQRDALDDKALCIREIIDASRSELDATARIDKLFVAAGDGQCVTLATGHKAKGQEWDNVAILDQHLLPGRWVTDAAALAQERNLLYVMVTRARLTVTYIRSDCWV